MRQEFWGPANGGWVPEPTFFKVASVLPGRPMEQAGVHAGDLLEAADGYPLNGAANWFLARAHFERNRPIELLVRRRGQLLALKLVIAAPVWRTLHGTECLPAIALQLARFMLLLLAILVGFSRPQQLSARLVALMFAMGSVAEGYPSAGWASGLRHLPVCACDPYRSGHGFLPIGMRSLADVFCELPSTSVFATVAMGPGGRTASAFWNADRGLGDRNDLCTIRFG